MPLHDYFCGKCNEIEERFCAVADLDKAQVCYCGAVMERVFLRFPFATVQEDICYDSPIDGRPITSKQARIEDLARADCVPYEEGIRQDQDRRKRESEAALDRAVDATVEREIALMPAKKKEKLTAELQGGMDATPVRVTPQQVSFRDG
jgi:hypothetical protein